MLLPGRLYGGGGARASGVGWYEEAVGGGGGCEYRAEYCCGEGGGIGRA